MQAAYADAAVDRFAAWVHESDLATRSELARRGFSFDTTTRAMGMPLDDLPPARPTIHIGPAEWSAYLSYEGLPLGFRDLYGIARWHFDEATDAISPPAGISLRPLTVADLPRLALYDRPLTGMERPAILAHLALRQPGRAWIAEDAARKIVGFVLGREGRVATSLGPVVADNEAVALALIARAAASAPGPFIIDVPVAHGAVRAWLEGQGATSPRGYMRMTLGEAKGLDDPSHVFALAGPELG